MQTVCDWKDENDDVDDPIKYNGASRAEYGSDVDHTMRQNTRPKTPAFVEYHREDKSDSNSKYNLHQCLNQILPDQQVQNMAKSESDGWDDDRGPDIAVL